MSSRSLAAARARRAGENPPPVSGNRPITSIGSQAAFAQAPTQYTNVRTARPIQQNYPQNTAQVPNNTQTQNDLPFKKLTVSDAIGLITIRLGIVEKWIVDTENKNDSREVNGSEDTNIPENHKLVDNSVFSAMIHRLDSLEKKTSILENNKETSKTINDIEELNQLKDELNTIKEQLSKINDSVNKHTIEIAKNTEQVFKFNRELTETKDILKSFMIKYDMFAQETAQNFTDYENALSDIETKFNTNEHIKENTEDITDDNETNEIQSEQNIEENVTIDLKKAVEVDIKEQFANIYN